MTKPDPSIKTMQHIADYWLYLPVDVKLEVIAVTIIKRIKNMSSGRRTIILAFAALAVITFIVVASLTLGAMSPAMRLTMYALMLGLVIGALVAWLSFR